MTVKITMPKLKESMDSCVLCAWHVDVGYEITAGEVLCEVEVDKVVSEIIAEKDMEIISLEVEEGDEVKIGDTLAIGELV